MRLELNPVEWALEARGEFLARMLVFAVSCSVSVLFFAVLFAQPAKHPKTGKPAGTPSVGQLVGATIALHVVLFCGVVAFHTVAFDGDHAKAPAVPYMVLCGVLFVFWGLLVLGATVFLALTKGRTAAQDRMRSFSMAAGLLLYLGNLAYFAIGAYFFRASERRLRDRQMYAVQEAQALAGVPPQQAAFAT